MILFIAFTYCCFIVRTKNVQFIQIILFFQLVVLLRLMDVLLRLAKDGLCYHMAKTHNKRHVCSTIVYSRKRHFPTLLSKHHPRSAHCGRDALSNYSGLV